jgi:hypothetical protein
MNINSVGVSIKATGLTGTSNFGFDFSFIDGLNILTGHNSSGKSTVLSCIYYSLGLEQLIGNRGAKALSPALHEQLKVDSQTYKVKTSKCYLFITGKDGKKYKISRWIVDESGGKTSHKEIEVEEEGKAPFSKFIQSEQDHGEHGFYRWLADAIGLDIIEIEGADGKSSKPLYVQNIFTSAFIEQTKGWADYFSMMPTFGIKDVKQKVIEYCLGLNSLEMGAKKDEVKRKKEEYKQKWKEQVEQLENRSKSVGMHLAKLDRNTPQVENAIGKIKVERVNSSESVLDIETYIKFLSDKIEMFNKQIEQQTTGSLKDLDLVEKEKETKLKILQYQTELENILTKLNKERIKIESYNRALEDIEFDIKDFKGLKKISLNRNWGVVSNPNCPVCDSSIGNKANFNLPEDKVTKTIEFLKSKRNTYSTYLTASQAVIQKYSVAVEFYKKKIRHHKSVIDSLFIDLKQPQIFAVSSIIKEKVEFEKKLIEVEFFHDYFLQNVGQLKGVSEQYYFYVAEEKKFIGILESDEQKIRTFKNTFVTLLDKFGYKSNGTQTIDILKSGYNRLLPVDNPYSQEPQNIRFVSSASDFVRSIWAYYLALMKTSSRHPGFLVFDEPGQHQMRVDSMKALLRQAVNEKRQMIFAISQDRNFDDQRLNIPELTTGIDEKEFKVVRIKDNEQCITAK